MRYYIHYYKLLGSVIYPEIALAAATALFAKYIFELLLPILPTKFLFVVEIQTSPSPKIPIYPPKHAPQVGFETTAPASTKVSIYPNFVASLNIF